ncbi:MAG: prepilin-type N-terminal cleavage/methylation domain-containing protein [Lentimonas sp.]|jgi:prepilin-type N-terminal cleavage/methylation domain-containing protein
MKMRPPLQPKNAAFTLIEVLIATALFAMAATALTGVVVNTLTALQAHPKWTTEGEELRFVLQEIERIDNREELETGGEIPLIGEQRVNWTVAWEPTGIADLFRIELELSWDGDAPSAQARETQLTLYWLRPWLSEPDEREALLDEKRSELEARK